MDYRVSHVFLAVLLGGLLFIGGCNGILQKEPQDTLTPVPETPTPESNTIPGVAGGQLAEPFALADAHREWLRNRSYTSIERIYIRKKGEVTHQRTTKIRWAGGEEERYLSTELLTPHPMCEGTNRSIRIDRYAADDRLYINESRCGRTNTRLVRGPDGDPVDPRDYLPIGPTRHEFLLSTLGQLDESRLTISNTSSESFRLSVPVEDYSAEPYPIEVDGTTTNASVSFLITEDGFISEYQIRYEFKTNQTQYSVTRHGSFTMIGETSIAPPGWLPESRDTSRHATLS